MVLRQIEYLTALARERHFGRAAAFCHVSQPALSVAVKKLEAELGLQLVRRDGRRCELTSEGRDLLRWADQVIAGVEGLKSEAANLKGELRGRLRLGVIPTALPVVGRIVGPLLQAHPSVDVDVHSMSSREIGLQLKTHGIDAGLTYLDNEPIGEVETHPVYEEEYVFVTASRELLSPVDWSALDGISLCLLSGEMQNRRIVDSLLERAAAKAVVRFQTDSISALVSLVRSGWACIVSRAWIDLYGLPSGMRALTLRNPEVRHQIGLVIPRTELAPPTVRALVHLIASQSAGESASSH